MVEKRTEGEMEAKGQKGNRGKKGVPGLERKVCSAPAESRAGEESPR